MRTAAWEKIGLQFVVLCFGVLTAVGRPDFRRSFWGDTVEQVKLVEDLQLAFEDLDKDREKLRYHVELEGIQMVAYYNFVGGKLCRAGYYALRTHYSDERLLQAFRDMERKLNDKYGLPDYGEDLNDPHKKLVWYSHTAKIVLSLLKSSGESPTLALFYYSIELAHLSGAFKVDPY